MKTSPIVPARIEFRDGVPYAPDFDDVYHPQVGAEAQARHVFLAGNGLPQRWQGRERFVVLETGFGLGHNFLATLAAWRADAARCERLCFISVEKHPPTRADLLRVHGNGCELAAAWPPLTPNLHTLAFDGGRATLLLALGDVGLWLPEIVATVDAFYLDGFAPARNPAMWERRLFKALGRLAAPGATASTWSVAREVRAGLAEAGFAVSTAPGTGGKREITLARFEPAYTPRRAPSRGMPVAAREALVIGAGLAGAATAHALAAQGYACTVLERLPRPAMATSGNPAGLFHGIVNAQDGAHARFHRAAALRAAQVYAPLLASGAVPGRIDGLLRLETERPDVQAMRRRLAALGLPAEYVDALGAAAAGRVAGLPLAHPAWAYAAGGWLRPEALVRHWLAHERIRFAGNAAVAALRRDGEAWTAVAADGQVLAQAPIVVLANAADAQRLLGAAWPVQSVRGQVTRVRGAPGPRVPVAGAGYALTLDDGSVLCGATSHANDDDAQLRMADHAANVAQLAALTGVPAQTIEVLDGRVGWRFATDDRLPIVGPVPDEASPAQRLEQPRLVPRRPGLYACTALGSRGITWAPLLGETLAAWVTGAPLPLEASLVDAIDAARFVSRAARRGVHQKPSPNPLPRGEGYSQPPPSER